MRVLIKFHGKKTFTNWFSTSWQIFTWKSMQFVSFSCIDVKQCWKTKSLSLVSQQQQCYRVYKMFTSLLPNSFSSHRARGLVLMMCKLKDFHSVHSFTFCLRQVEMFAKSFRRAWRKRMKRKIYNRKIYSQCPSISHRLSCLTKSIYFKKWEFSHTLHSMPSRITLNDFSLITCEWEEIA